MSAEKPNSEKDLSKTQTQEKAETEKVLVAKTHFKNIKILKTSPEETQSHPEDHSAQCESREISAHHDFSFQASNEMMCKSVSTMKQNSKVSSYSSLNCADEHNLEKEQCVARKFSPVKKFTFGVQSTHSNSLLHHKEFEPKRHIVNVIALPDDVLFLIFKNLRPIDLCRLCSVCQRFFILASKDSVWLHHARKVPINIEKSSFKWQYPSVKEFYRVATNWHLGKYREVFAVKSHYRDKLIPWIQKTDDSLWFSYGSKICNFTYHPSGNIHEQKARCLLGMKGDVTRFSVKNNLVISGCRDGSIYSWDTSGNQLFHYKHVHNSDTQCVDFTDNVVISGSRDGTCKILQLDSSSNDDVVLRTYDAGERVWCLSISPCQSFFAAGLAGCLDDPPVVLWDLESSHCLGHLSVNHRRGAGVYDLKFESPHELLTCGYDTFMRLWDLRIQKCVNQWEEPYDSALYCIETDNNTLAVGTARHGMVRLWDKRKMEPLQVYYSNKCNSPVYSLAMDYGHLYLALDLGLNLMDFTSYQTPRAHRPFNYIHS
ncbi:unnamed protein product [Lymnaea stagnalis]|uniref:F-box domain-containing protein n=1 Tax=Lymnaea stagnalis TaxID=6523 RepID=A0AAV2H5G5_LYMST